MKILNISRVGVGHTPIAPTGHWGTSYKKYHSFKDPNLDYIYEFPEWTSGCCPHTRKCTTSFIIMLVDAAPWWFAFDSMLVCDIVVSPGKDLCAVHNQALFMPQMCLRAERTLSQFSHELKLCIILIFFVCIILHMANQLIPIVAFGRDMEAVIDDASRGSYSYPRELVSEHKHNYLDVVTF